MSSILIIANLFVTLGYTIFAVALLVFFMVFRKNPYTVALAGISNGLLAFYCLCCVLLYTTVAAKVWFAAGKSPVTLSAYFRATWDFILVLACMAVPFLRRRPVWLLLPMALLINYRKTLPGGDIATFFKGLYQSEQAVLWGMCALYFLVILALFLLSLWIKRIMAEEQL